jgi:nucleotide-binding universal stress UspA family protein
MPVAARYQAAAGPREPTVLVVADDLADADGAVAVVLARAHGGSVDLHLVNVQPALGANVSRFVDRATIRRFQRDEGEARIERLRRTLRAQRLRCIGHVMIGDAPARIRALADDIGADEVVIAQRPSGLLGRVQFDLWVRGIARASTVPVTIIAAQSGTRAERFRLGWGVALQRP